MSWNKLDLMMVAMMIKLHGEATKDMPLRNRCGEADDGDEFFSLD